MESQEDGSTKEILSVFGNLLMFIETDYSMTTCRDEIEFSYVEKYSLSWYICKWDIC